MQRLSANFQTLVSNADAGMVAVPKMQALLTDPNFKGFSVYIPGFSSKRKPDGWFHPSTHPLWAERQLYYYLTQPDDLVEDPFDSAGALAVTVGSTLHDAIQSVGLANGLLERFPNCACGGKHNEAEVMLIDEDAGCRGHSDGVWQATGDGFEIKTAHSNVVDGMNKVAFGEERLEFYRSKKPQYYAQNQEYLRMSGRDRMIVMFVGTQYPYAFSEIHVPFDRAYSFKIRSKYLRVREAVKNNRPPMECCGSKSNCPARSLCSGYIN
jgi:hypothetical protein